MFKQFGRLLIFVLIVITDLIQCSYSNFSIEQCPGTNVLNIKHQTEFNEISLIFYYTQWNEESLEALKEFNDVAAYFEDKVYFATIDCWHLACNCSRTLSTRLGSGSPHKWPTLIVYYGGLGRLKIEYNGLFMFRDMVQFVINVMQPIERVQTRRDLEKMQSMTHAIVLGIFEKPSNEEYKHYLKAALKWLEHDPMRSYRFTITFGKNEKDLNETNIKEPNILLLSQKVRKSFSEYSDFKWNSSNILHWIQENNDNGLWYGYSTPITISKKIMRQPVLAIFVNDPQKFFLYMEKYVDSQKPFTKASLSCESTQKRTLIKNVNKIRANSMILKYLKKFDDNSKCHWFYKDILLRNLNFYYEIKQYFELPELANPSHYNHNLEELLRFFQSSACLLKKDHALQTSLHISTVKRLEDYLVNEQQCKNDNRSLAVVLLDTQRYKDFLDNIDISPTSQSMATVFIADNDNENIFIMEDHFAMYNLMEFVNRFYANSLNNYFKNKEHIPVKSPLLNTSMQNRNYDIELKQLNRVIFLNHFQYSHNQTLVVLIYSPDCALCGNIQNSFLQLSLSLRSVENLQFIRINTIDNDLSWQFNMPFLPALIVFPEKRYSESRIFPTHLKPDARNIFGFILSQLSAPQQIELVLAICQSGTLSRNYSENCWQFAKAILMQHIGKHLQYWQIFETERSLIFERLRAFKNISLDVSRRLRL